jgi:hypothetical protein
MIGAPLFSKGAVRSAGQSAAAARGLSPQPPFH